jgi:prepilin-type processing-associated H-X9-DG protein
MRTTMASKLNRALTRIEVLVIVAVVALLAAFVLTGLANSRGKSARIGCSNNLKQIGLVFKLFANDNSDKYPASVSVTNGGTMELVPRGDVFSHFQVMSNEVKSLKLLICPADTRRPAKSWATLSNTNISYFIGLDAGETQPGMWLAGDRNLEIDGAPAKPGLLLLWSNSVVGWTRELHNRVGNVAYADGHVDTAESLRRAWQGSGVTNRLAIP